MQSGWNLQGQIPVFLSDDDLIFYIGDPRRHTNTVTVLNPYEFEISYQVFSTDVGDEKYTVVEPNGTVKGKHCKDFILRHNAPFPSNCDVTDKFQVKIYDNATKQFLGKKTISATLRGGVPNNYEASTSSNHQRRERSGTTRNENYQRYDSDNRNRSANTPNSPFIISLGLLCFCALIFVPTDRSSCQGDSSSHFVLSDHVKFICAFILGMVTLTIFRQ